MMYCEDEEENECRIDKNEGLLDEDRYDYWELYYNTKDVCYNMYVEKGVLDEMGYSHFFDYIMNIVKGEREWVELESFEVFRTYKKECMEWWFQEYKREVFEIKRCIERYIQTEVSLKNVKDLCYTYSSSGYF
jgi:hypothetical protein